MLYKTIEKKHTYNNFSIRHKPVEKIDSGSVLIFETIDASGNQMNGNEFPDTVELDSNRTLPMTGPVYINNCMPGDTLKIKIMDIELSNTGYTWSRPGLGVLHNSLERMIYKRIDIDQKNNRYIFDESKNIAYAINPMVGIIGVAIESEIPNKFPGNHGGNLDSTSITIGSEVYIPVYIQGGLLFMGDVHAAMGDGELCGSGVECDGRVTVEISVMKNKKIDSPQVVHKNRIIFLESGEKFDDSIKTLARRGIDYLMEIHGLDYNNAYLLLSNVGNIKICQVVNTIHTLSLSLPIE